MKKMYECNRGGKVRVAELVSMDESAVVLMQDGVATKLAPASFKRWWHEVSTQDEKAAPAVKPAVTTKEAPKKEAPKKEITDSKKVPKKRKVKTTQNNDYADLHKAFIEYVEGLKSKDAQINLWHSSKVKSFYTIKYADRISCAFTISHIKGITLWLRSKAVGDLPLPSNSYTLKHMLDVRFSFTDWLAADKAAIQKLLQASFDYQKNKGTGSKKEKAKKSK